MNPEHTSIDSTSKYNHIHPLVADLRERVQSLRLYDAEHEINSYCDDLEGQVILTVESAIRELNVMQEKLLAEVQSYRSERLNYYADSENTKQTDAWSVERTEAIINLQREIDEFAISCSEQEDLIEKSRTQANNLIRKIDSLEREIRNKIFGGRFMRFIPNQLFGLDAYLLGKFHFYSHDLLSTNRSPGATMEHDYMLFQSGTYLKLIRFLTDESLLTCDIETRVVQIWDTKAKLLRHSLVEDQTTPPTCFVKLSAEYLAIGRIGGTISIWNLEQQSRYKILEGPSGSQELCRVTSMVVFKSGSRIASITNHGWLKIWDPFSDNSKNILETNIITKYRIPTGFNSTNSLGLLSNDFLVTGTTEGFIQIWDSSTLREVLRIEVGCKVLFFSILSNDDILVNGKSIYSVVHKSLVSTLEHSDQCISYDCFELENGCLVTCQVKTGTKNRVEFTVWNTDTTCALQKIQISQNEKLGMIALSRSGIAAFASYDGEVTISSMKL